MYYVNIWITTGRFILVECWLHHECKVAQPSFRTEETRRHGSALFGQRKMSYTDTVSRPGNGKSVRHQSASRDFFHATQSDVESLLASMRMRALPDNVTPRLNGYRQEPSDVQDIIVIKMTRKHRFGVGTGVRNKLNCASQWDAGSCNAGLLDRVRMVSGKRMAG